MVVRFIFNWNVWDLVRTKEVLLSLLIRFVFSYSSYYHKNVRINNPILIYWIPLFTQFCDQALFQIRRYREAGQNLSSYESWIVKVDIIQTGKHENKWKGKCGCYVAFSTNDFTKCGEGSIQLTFLILGNGVSLFRMNVLWQVHVYAWIL